MDRNKTAGQALVSAAEWFAGGRRLPYDPGSGRVLTEEEAVATQGALRVFERVSGAARDTDTVWLTMLPGFPDGSYGWAHLTTGEHPDLLAAAIRDIAVRHGVATLAVASS